MTLISFGEIKSLRASRALLSRLKMLLWSNQIGASHPASVQAQKSPAYSEAYLCLKVVPGGGIEPRRAGHRHIVAVPQKQQRPASLQALK